MKTFRITMITILTILLIMMNLNLFSSKPHKDESILLPSTYGWIAGGELNISVRAWIFEPEEDSLLRNGFVKLLEEPFENAGIDEKRNFEERVRYFLTDNKRGRKITVNIMGEQHTLPATSPNGHTLSIIKFSESAGHNSSESMQSFTTVPGENGSKTFSGSFRIIGENGFSIISDIDDTIKISNVSDRKELVKNTFLRKFVPVEGMPRLYKKLEKKGAAFHYLSGSPWQLYPAIRDFLESEHFPAGSVELKLFRIKDKSFINFITADQLNYKISSIKTIIDRFPGRKFVLIGDSGEKDPEAYSEIAGQYRERIKYIFIRDAGSIDINSARRNSVIKKAGNVKFIIFKNADELDGFVKSL